VPVSTHGALLGGRYRVERPLGLGGMAQVLLCTDERLGRRVAVKRLYADSPEEVETRFGREARLGALLNHPNLVSVFDTAADADGVLIVMEYVQGEALSRVLRRGPLGSRRVARMARELGAALDHAHGHGVVHRDVKPGNVLLRVDGVTKLADLGIATAVDLTSITHSGEVLGTAAYMAPEQLEGSDAGPASDVYALAAVCYEALAGERARRGRSALEIAHRIATEGPPDIRERLDSVPRNSARALQRGMARDPGERPSAGEFAAEFAGPLEGVSAAEDRPTEQLASTLPTRPQRRPNLAAAGRARQTAPRATAAPTAPPPTRVPPVRPVAAAEARPARASRRARPLAIAALLALFAAVAAVALLSTGGDGGGRDSAPAPDRADRAGQGEAGRAQGRGNDEPAGRRRAEARREPAAPAPEPPAPEREAQAPAPSEPTQPPVATPDPARGAQLNNEGFALMGRGEFAAAVPILQEAVASWPEGSTDINYAYALFNLGKSLNRAGRPDEAIPYLEKRLAWNDQRATVQAELDLARRNAAAD
jgi:tRNA A-37 threonylcarbamoyl transferase component Bud32